MDILSLLDREGPAARPSAIYNEDRQKINRVFTTDLEQ